MSPLAPSPLCAPCAASPRLAPKLTAPLPELSSAATEWAQRQQLQQAQRQQPGAAGSAGTSSAGAAAAAAAAGAAAPLPARPAVRPELLPLRELRRGGRLFTEQQDAVPAVVRPAQPLRLPLRLGSVELPLATLDAEKLKALQGRQHWSALEWGGKSQLMHDYVGPLPPWLGGFNRTCECVSFSSPCPSSSKGQPANG